MATQALRFREAKRTQESFLASMEKKTLLWLAARTPGWINSDHLTALGLLAMAAAGAGYWWSRTNTAGLLVVILGLAVNWLGDSLDGTLARVRNCPRPRYGFYVDHIVDAFGALFLLGGLALSGYMSSLIAIGLPIAYLLLSIEVYLASYTLGNFKISYFKMSPTELRILLSVGVAGKDPDDLVDHGLVSDADDPEDESGDGHQRQGDREDRRQPVPGDDGRPDASDADVRFTPEAGADRVGFSVAGSFDDNADGYGDLLLGAPGESTNGADAGSVYLIVGR